MMRLEQASAAHFDAFENAVAPHVRDGFMAHFGQTVRQVMENGLRLSTHAWAGYSDDEPLVMLGISPVSMLSGIGQAWIVPTVHICKHPIAFARASKRMTDHMLSVYRVLMCWVHEEEVTEMQWMRWLGFQFRQTETPLVYAVLER